MFLLAGYEQTVEAICYCLYVLATNQEELAKVKDEIDTKIVFPQSESESKVKINDYQNNGS